MCAREKVLAKFSKRKVVSTKAASYHLFYENVLFVRANAIVDVTNESILPSKIVVLESENYRCDSSSDLELFFYREIYISEL